MGHSVGRKIFFFFGTGLDQGFHTELYLRAFYFFIILILGQDLAKLSRYDLNL